MAEMLRAVTEPTVIPSAHSGRAFLRAFVLYAGLAIALFYLFPSQRMFGWLLEWLAITVGGIASILGVDALVSESLVVIPGEFGIDIAIECSGVPELLLFLCAVLAFPTTPASKLLGVTIAIVGVTTGNVLRLAALFLVGVRAPEYFDPVHTYVQGMLSYVLMAVLWIGWLKLSATRAKR